MSFESFGVPSVSEENSKSKRHLSILAKIVGLRELKNLKEASIVSGFMASEHFGTLRVQNLERPHSLSKRWRPLSVLELPRSENAERPQSCTPPKTSKRLSRGASQPFCKKNHKAIEASQHFRILGIPRPREASIFLGFGV